MKYLSVFFLLSLIFLTTQAQAIETSSKQYSGKGEVTSVDPLYSRVTIQHEAIKGFAGDAETEFFVAGPDLLKQISVRDLVEFEITEFRGDAKIQKISKTGVAEPKKEGLPVGQAVQDVLVGTGEVMKGVTSPIAPAHEVVSGTVGVTTDATGSVLEDATTESKTKF